MRNTNTVELEVRDFWSWVSTSVHSFLVYSILVWCPQESTHCLCRRSWFGPLCWSPWTLGHWEPQTRSQGKQFLLRLLKVSVFLAYFIFISFFSFAGLEIEARVSPRWGKYSPLSYTPGMSDGCPFVSCLNFFEMLRWGGGGREEVPGHGVSVSFDSVTTGLFLERVALLPEVDVCI